MKVLEDYEVAEEELYSHIAIFLENNQSLLLDQSRDNASQEDTDSRQDING